MTTKIKTTLLTAFFFFGLLTGLQAQDKYEYAIVTNSGLTDLAVIKQTTEYIKLPKDADRLGELNKKAAEMNKEGWEVYNTTTAGMSGFAYFMRRKLKD